jgi:hypothetical protein
VPLSEYLHALSVTFKVTEAHSSNAELRSCQYKLLHLATSLFNSNDNTNWRRAWDVITYGKKCKVIPVQAVEALRVARGWGSHIFRHSAHRWWQGCQPYGPAAFYPQEDSWYSFLLEAESTPRVIVRLERLCKLKIFTSSGTGDLPACSTAPLIRLVALPPWLLRSLFVQCKTGTCQSNESRLDRV